MRRVEAPASRTLAKFSASLVYIQLLANLQLSNFRCKTMTCMRSACSYYSKGIQKLLWKGGRSPK